MRMGYRFGEHNRHKEGMASLKMLQTSSNIPLPSDFQFAQKHWGVAVPLVDAHDDVVEWQGPTGETFLGQTPKGELGGSLATKSIALLSLSKCSHVAEKTNENQHVHGSNCGLNTGSFTLCWWIPSRNPGKWLPLSPKHHSDHCRHHCVHLGPAVSAQTDQNRVERTSNYVMYIIYAQIMHHYLDIIYSCNSKDSPEHPVMLSKTQRSQRLTPHFHPLSAKTRRSMAPRYRGSLWWSKGS